MNRRFKIKNDFVTIGDYGSLKDNRLTLLLRVPYKIFGITKYKYLNVCTIFSCRLPKRVITEKDIEKYIVQQFYRERREIRERRYKLKKR